VAPPPVASPRPAASHLATGAANTRSSSRIVGGLLLLGLLYVMQLSEAPELEVHRRATTSLQAQASSTLERVQELGSSLGQGIAQAESEDLWDMWGEPEIGTRPAVVSQAPSRAEAGSPAQTRSASETPPPPPPPRPPPPPAAAAEARSLPAKACAQGCHTHGNCNEELGRCDCPPLSEGATCELGVAPKCRTQWGLSLPYPPCQAWTSEETDWRDFPPTCDCLAECHALNHRAPYVSSCVNTTRQPLLGQDAKGSRELEQAGKALRDPFGDGRWIRQAYTPGRKDPPLSEARIGELNVELQQRLTRDAEASLLSGACSGRGLRTPRMPWKPRGPNTKEAEPTCHCLPGWFGAQCEWGPGHPALPESKQFCVHGCSGRGVCKLNWCHCVPGTWGVDCSFGTPRAAVAEQAARQQREAESVVRRAVPAGPSSSGGGGGGGGDAQAVGLGWPDAMLSAPAPQLPAAAPQLRIYIYDLPPQFNSWLAAHFRRPGRWDQSYLYSLDAKLHRWLLRSPYRTLDPAQADYFLVPAYLSLGFYDYEFGLYWLTSRGNAFLREVMAYVQKTWPHYERRGGADHLLVMTNDKGATFIRGSVPAVRPMTLVTQWGWKRAHIHLPAQDIVVPPMLKVDKLLGETPFLDTAPATTDGGAGAGAAPWRYLLSFIGSVRFHTPGYSMGVRQAVYRRYNETAGFFLRDLRGDTDAGKHKQMGPREYLAVMQQSKFCLAPSGMGFSTRMYESIAQGCVPLIIQDEPVSNTSVDQAFEELLPYRLFSLRLTQADIPRLPEILDAFPADAWHGLRRNLACVWPRVLWLVADNEAPGRQVDAASRRSTATEMLGDQGFLRDYDAWTSLMTTLSRRAARRRNEAVPPFEWRTPARSCRAPAAATT